VLATSLLLGWFLLLPHEYKQLGKHSFSGATFISNFVFWQELGYFDSRAETKPLLHLWSLGIEEQFYLVFPSLLWFSWKRFSLFWLFSLVALASFIASLDWVMSDRAAAFYLPHARIWKLLLGVLCAYFVVYKNFSFCHFRVGELNALSVLGGVLVLAGLLRANGYEPYSSWWGLLSVSGCCVLFLARPSAFLNRAVLARPLMVFIGLLSFSLYLWHWLAVSYSKIIFQGEIPAATTVMIVALTIVFSLASYYWVENPVRGGGRPRIKVVLAFFSVLFIGGIGHWININNGLAARPTVPKDYINSRQLGWNTLFSTKCLEYFEGEKFPFCTFAGDQEKTAVAVLGDSTANAMFPGIASLLPGEKGALNIGSYGCPPVRGTVSNRHWGKPSIATIDCDTINRRAYDIVLNDPSIRLVVLGFHSKGLGYWGLPGLKKNASLTDRFNALRPRLERDLSALRKAEKSIIVSFDVSVFPVHAESCIDRPL